MAWSEPEDMVTKAKPRGLPLSRSWGMKQSCVPAGRANKCSSIRAGRVGAVPGPRRPGGALATPEISNKQAAHLHVAVGGEQVAQLIHAGPPGDVSHVQLDRHPVPAFTEPNRTRNEPKTSRKRNPNQKQTARCRAWNNVVGEGWTEAGPCVGQPRGLWQTEPQHLTKCRSSNPENAQSTITTGLQGQRQPQHSLSAAADHPHLVLLIPLHCP